VLEIPRYLAGSGNDVFGAWMSGLQYDRTKGKIVAWIDRLSLGNIGDCKALYKGLFELRIDWGPGYQVYYALAGRACVVLLCGATSANSHLTSYARWNTLKDYKKRTS
jgi:putative addiction module killer protein